MNRLTVVCCEQGKQVNYKRSSAAALQCISRTAWKIRIGSRIEQHDSRPQRHAKQGPIRTRQRLGVLVWGRHGV
jgi:hypothetical protein